MKPPYRVLIVLMIALLVLAALPVSAQEAEEPARTGLRPDAPPFAIRGPYPVGVIELEVDTGSEETTVSVWYPALNPEGMDEEVTYSYSDPMVASDPLPVYGSAIRDAEPANSGPYPLVIFVHAGWQGRISASYLAEHLASHGFAVMAIDYIDQGDWSILPGEAMYSRLQHVPWQIDYAEMLTGTDGALQAVIDTEQVALIGSEYIGAEATLLMGGARLDTNGPSSMCVLDPELSTFCTEFGQQMVDQIGLETVPDGLWPSWADTRVDAIVLLAPLARLFGSESLQSVTVSTMILVSSDLTAPEHYQLYLYDNHGSSRKSFVVYEEATSHIFANECDRMPWLVDFDFFPFCSDPVWDMDRAHDLSDHFIAAFLLAVLKDDADAAAALAPDAVTFPGIRYETTMGQ